MRTSYYISDLHLGHRNILEYSKETRPFSSITEHDEFLIDSINSTVNPTDTLYMLGDITCGSREALKYVKQIKARRKILVLGNHDEHSMLDYLDAGFSEIYGSYRHHEFLLTHIPVYPGFASEGNRGWQANVHGHLHSKELEDSRYINVNIDIIGFIPASLQELRDKLRYNKR